MSSTVTPKRFYQAHNLIDNYDNEGMTHSLIEAVIVTT